MLAMITLRWVATYATATRAGEADQAAVEEKSQRVAELFAEEREDESAETRLDGTEEMEEDRRDRSVPGTANEGSPAPTSSPQAQVEDNTGPSRNTRRRAR